MPKNHLVALAFLFLSAPAALADEDDFGEQGPCALTYAKSTHVYKKTPKGLSIEADVYRVQDDKVRPILLWLHGGGLIYGSRKELRQERLQDYIRAGYTVVAADYRLAPESKLPEIVGDVKDALAWVHKNIKLLKGDARLIGAVGHSAGGYLAQTLGTLPAPPKALVSFYGYGKITSPWYAEKSTYYNGFPKVRADTAAESLGQSEIEKSSGELNRSQYYIYLRQSGTWPQGVSGGRDPRTDAAWFAPYEPAQRVSRSFSPTLFLHGKRDADVPVQESETMAAALKAKGVEARLVTNPGWGHAFEENQDFNAREIFQQEVFPFLDKHLNQRTKEEREKSRSLQVCERGGQNNTSPRDENEGDDFGGEDEGEND
jgi:acetyl esterase/lipase